MSRRRPGPEPHPIPGYKKINVVCTDDGQHTAVSFGHIEVWPEGDGWRVKERLNYRDDEYVDLGVLDHAPPPRLHKTYPLKCRRCGRNVPLRAETIERVFAALAALDTPTFDISSPISPNIP